MNDKDLKRWGSMPAIYDDHTLKIDGFEVMEDWERPYMDRLAAIAARNGGDVLEVGYGMGISSGAIEAFGVNSHSIIECHPDVIARCLHDHREEIARGQIRILSGLWQEVTPSIKSGSFDGILFDTYPIVEEEMIGPHMFFFKEAYRLLKKGGILTYYSDEESSLSDQHVERLLEAGFTEDAISFDVCDVSPPPGCEYWSASTILAPIIIKAA